MTNPTRILAGGPVRRKTGLGNQRNGEPTRGRGNRCAIPTAPKTQVFNPVCPVEAAGPVDVRCAAAHRALEIAARFPQLPQGLLRQLTIKKFSGKMNWASELRTGVHVSWKHRESMTLKNHKGGWKRFTSHRVAPFPPAPFRQVKRGAFLRKLLMAY